MRKRMYFQLLFLILFTQICAEWEIPEEFWPPAILATIQNGFQSPVYYTKNAQDLVAQRQWLSQIVADFGGDNKMPMFVEAEASDSQGANSNGDSRQHYNLLGSEHTVSQNLYTITALMGRKAVDDGCEVFMNPSKRLDIEIGTQNITIGCPKAVNVSAISENIYFCVNGTECQKAKTKWSAGCAVFILPDKANRSNYGTEKAPPIGCNDSLVPTSLHITFLEERAPDLRASYYQKRGRFHCPSDVTCLYEMLFPYNFEVVEGRNAVEMSHLAINLTIALFLVFLNGCKLNLGN